MNKNIYICGKYLTTVFSAIFTLLIFFYEDNLYLFSLYSFIIILVGYPVYYYNDLKLLGFSNSELELLCIAARNDFNKMKNMKEDLKKFQKEVLSDIEKYEEIKNDVTEKTKLLTIIENETK